MPLPLPATVKLLVDESLPAQPGVAAAPMSLSPHPPGNRLTLVYVAVSVADDIPEAPAKPTRAFAGSEIVCDDPSCVHVTPSLENPAVMEFPDRTSRTYSGACPDRALVEAVPPEVKRVMNSTLFVGVTTIAANAALAARLPRNITPAIAPLLGFVSEATFAMIAPSPLKDFCEK